VFRKLLNNNCHDLLDVTLPLFFLFRNFGSKIIVYLRVEVAEGEVFQFALNRGNTQSVRHRRVDIEGFLGDTALFGFRLVLQRPHVVQAVSQLDQDDPDIIGHGQEHLAKILRLTLLLGLEIYFAYLGDTIDQIGYFGAEDVLQLLVGGECVFQCIMQQTGYHVGTSSLRSARMQPLPWGE